MPGNGKTAKMETSRGWKKEEARRLKAQGPTKKVNENVAVDCKRLAVSAFSNRIRAVLLRVPKRTECHRGVMDGCDERVINGG